MRIWTVLSQKGGSGKTTLVLHLAVAAIASGHAVSVIDVDTQRSAEKWGEQREGRHGELAPAIVHGLLHDIDGMIEGAREAGTDLVLIDTPPATNNTTLRAGGVADMIIVPTRASTLDVDALKETLQALADAGKLDRTVLVLNAANGDASMLAEIRRLARSTFEVPVVPVALRQSTALSRSLGKGLGITEQSPRSSAAGELTGLLDALMKHDRRLERARRKETA